MKGKRLFTVRSLVCAAGLLALSVPTQVWAQTSGAPPPPGVVTRTLPRTGDPTADTQTGVPPLAFGLGAAAAGLVLWRGTLRYRSSRKNK